MVVLGLDDEILNLKLIVTINQFGRFSPNF